MSVKPDRILRFDAALTPKDVETIRELVADAQANVLLRDTPEDRERLIAALARWWEAEAPDHGQNDAEADAIIAELRGER